MHYYFLLLFLCFPDNFIHIFSAHLSSLENSVSFCFSFSFSPYFFKLICQLSTYHLTDLTSADMEAGEFSIVDLTLPYLTLPYLTLPHLTSHTCMYMLVHTSLHAIISSSHYTSSNLSSNSTLTLTLTSTSTSTSTLT